MPNVHNDASAPEVVPADLEVAPSTYPEHVGLTLGTKVPEKPWSYDQSKELRKYEAPSKQRSVCGLSPRNFWIIIIVLVIVIAAAIGGGVGGGLASQNKS